MKVIQIVKKLNNTELGKGGTHDTYVLIPNDLYITDIFDKQNTFIEFTDKYTGETVQIRNTVGREKRIVGLGQYYRNKNLSAGDEIVFEKQTLYDETKFKIFVKKYADNLVIQKSRYGFEVLTPDNIANLKSISSEIGKRISMVYLKSEKKRNDSPEKTAFYDIKIDDESLIDRYKNKDIIEIKANDKDIFITEFYGWKKYIFNTEE